MKKLIPDIYCKSIYDIDYKKLKDKNIKCLLFDLDNTCVPYPQKTPTEELKTLFKKLQEMDFKVIIFSNTTPNRLDKFKDIGVEVFGLSRKPSKNLTTGCPERSRFTSINKGIFALEKTALKTAALFSGSEEITAISLSFIPLLTREIICEAQVCIA